MSNHYFVIQSRRSAAKDLKRALAAGSLRTTNAFAVTLFALLLSAFFGTASASDKWLTETNQSAATLRSGNYANALKIADQTLSAMVEQLGAGGANDTMLATALTHKALANAGLGKINEALWYGISLKKSRPQ